MAEMLAWSISKKNMDYDKDFPANASVKILTPQEFFDYYAKLLQQQ